MIDLSVNEQSRGLFRAEGGGNDWRDLEEIGKGQVLSNDEIVELAKLVKRIEDHYGFPCDIEWAKEGDKFYIVQSRPITTLSKKNDSEKKKVVSKFYSREHSLFYYQIESDDNRNGHPDFPEWPPIKTVVVIKKPKTFKTAIWHNNKEVDFASDSFEKALLLDNSLFERVVYVFKDSFDKLRPFVEKTRKIENISDLKEYYSALMGFWSPMSFAMFVPDMESPPKEMLKKVLKLREETQDYADIFDELFLEYFESNFPQYSELSRYILPNELFVLENRAYTKEELKLFNDRKDSGYVMINDKFGKYSELDNLLEEENLMLERIKPLSSKKLKGSIACKGIVKGTIKVILDKKDLDIIKEGDIIVTEMTSPDFVPALKKCSAIITDEGGIACHAAIISRELNKPCVIGTKIATEFLKDGDEVEVDADEGVVRILEKNQKIILSKTNTRERSLFYVYAWNKSDIENSKKIWPDSVKNLVLISDSLSRFTSWYHQDELNIVYSKLEKKLKYKRYYKLLKKRYLDGIKEFSPYLENKKRIKSLNELENIYMDWLDWWHLVDFSMSVPEMEGVAEEIKNEMMGIREKTQHFPQLFNKIFIDFFSEKYPQYKKYVNVILPDEVFSLRKKPFLKDNLEMFNKRLNGCALVNSKLILLEDLENELNKNNLELEKPDTISDFQKIKGNSAYFGKIRGIVKLIVKSEDHLDIKNGEILVTEMTSPEFMSSIKKASAIVTDEGGITCHAAIIARELKKPCVIGTKNATKILKDGDLVEVDANEGVVRILEKNQKPIYSDIEKLGEYGSLEMSVVYPPQSVLLLEYMSSCLYKDNPLYKIIGYEPQQVGVILQDDEYEAWTVPGKRPIVEDCDKIKIINEASREFYKRAKKKFGAILKLNDEDLEKPENYIVALRGANKLNQEMYWHFNFYIEESFVTKDEALIFQLQKTRLLLDDLALNYLWKVYEKLIDALVNKYGVPEKIAKGATTEEIIKIVNSSENVSEFDYIVGRPIAWIHMDGKCKTVTGEEVREIRSYLTNQNPDKKKVEESISRGEIIGDIGNGGKVKGEVVKLLASDYENKGRLEEISRKNKFILVTPMTSPESVVYFRNAVGFVTDEGGITCHAAIIAREEKLPCIVNTKVATKVLEDGDLVEVDANEGVVRILEEEQRMINLQSREHSLIYCYVWHKSNQKCLGYFFNNIEELIFINKGFGKTSVWFESRELNEMYDRVGRRATEDKKYFSHNKKEFYKYFNRLMNYFDGKLNIASIKDLKDYYQTYIKWWSPMAIMYVLPESKTASEEIKKEALKIRSETEKYSDKNDLFFIENFNKLYPEYERFSNLLTPEEIFSLEDKKLAKKQISEIKKRENGYILYNGKLYSLSELDSILGENKLVLDEVKNKGDNIVSGQVAFKGNVRGRVRIIHSKKQLSNFKKGEVIVTEMTSPDYVPYMKNASAIITDEGGIVCHAAIVARELEIPCIIGTRVGTNALKDGDLVEVDANEGVVRILEKNQKPIYSDIMNHEFPAMIAELTDYGESLKEVPWSEKEFPYSPYCVFEKRGKTLYYFYDKEGIEWNINEAGKFDKEIMKDNAILFFDDIKKIVDEKPALSRKDFLEFIDKLKAGWTWWTCMWWMIEYYDKNNLPLDDILEVRKKTEKMAEGFPEVIRKSLKKIFPEHEKYVDAILIEDVERGCLPSNEVLEKRLKSFVYTNGEMYDSIEEVENKFNIVIKEHEYDGGTELYGQTAYPGIVKGKVRRVENDEDVKDFEEGEIIVSSTTTPNFISAMKKSSAIISEHGGVICHASITSRELRIPCVVGVRAVTKALKTGDLVEVDADKGVVRILDDGDK